MNTIRIMITLAVCSINMLAYAQAQDLSVVIDEPTYGKDYLEGYPIEAVGTTNGHNPHWTLDGVVVGKGTTLYAVAGEGAFIVGGHKLSFNATLGNDSYGYDIPIKVYKRAEREQVVKEARPIEYKYKDKVTGKVFLINDDNDTSTHIGTGRMFLKDDGYAYTFVQARRFIYTLNRSNHLGHSDWRLPSDKEMRLLFKVHVKRGETYHHWVDLKTIDSRINGTYWSSSSAGKSIISGEQMAWVYSTFSQGVTTKVKRKPSSLKAKRYIIPVRTNK